MRDKNPGDLSVRISFARVFNLGPEQGKLRPSLEITDGTSGLTLTVNITSEQLADLLSGSSAEVDANNVSGFGGLEDWGKYHEMVTAKVKVEQDDWLASDPRELPHLAPVVAEFKQKGYRVGEPRRSNAGTWSIVGRRYVHKL